MKTVSKEEEKLIEISEQKNPYAKECPNRHLWSEGFRSGYHTASERTAKLEELVKTYEKYNEYLSSCKTLSGKEDCEMEAMKHCIIFEAKITELNTNLK